MLLPQHTWFRVKSTLYFDLWYGKHSVSHVPSCSFWCENYLSFTIILIWFLLYIFCFFITFIWFFKYFGFLWRFRGVLGRFRWVPSGSRWFRLGSVWFRVVRAGSGRFRVGSVFYIHPKLTHVYAQKPWTAFSLSSSSTVSVSFLLGVH